MTFKKMIFSLVISTALFSTGSYAEDNLNYNEAKGIKPSDVIGRSVQLPADLKDFDPAANYRARNVNEAFEADKITKEQYDEFFKNHPNLEKFKWH